MPDKAVNGDGVHLLDTVEGQRTAQPLEAGWRRWGAYLSERQWGTVREDYSADGKAWEYLPFDQARSRAYRWGEDGIAGFSDNKLSWCLALALWNGRDPFIKERMFGLSNAQGNHGEDVKEVWWYLDATPSHSYMRMLYKYPQGAYPYEALIAENARRRGRAMPEYELIDTGAFDESRYFDVTVEYAKAGPDDIVMRITVENCGPDAARLCVMPHLWARNTWSWSEGAPRPLLRLDEGGVVRATHPVLAPMRLEALQPAEWLFCENETNTRRLFGTTATGHFKDAINDYVVHGDAAALNPMKEGTKCAALSRLELAPGGREVILLRFVEDRGGKALTAAECAAVLAGRRGEADAFYATLQREIADPDARAVQRQALAGMLWSKQYYNFEVLHWLSGDPAQPKPPDARLHGRDSRWTHLFNDDIVSMPDKWEYPWYAAWDLGFHCVTLALIDPAFAKNQLVLLTRDWYMHPSGQLPAYEWNFGDVNPPVHGWAAWRVYRMEHALTGRADRTFLETVFHRLMLNFTWWVNQKDAQGRDIFQGGFLGLDNIGIFDRSKPLPTGGYIDQSDGTAWMAMYSLNLMRIALELAEENPVYEDLAGKFFEHFLLIADAMENLSGTGTGLWDDEDEFYYDVLNLPGGDRVPLRIRSLVGIIPLCAVEVVAGTTMERFPRFAARANWLLENRPRLSSVVSRWTEPGKGNRLLLSLLRRHRLKALLLRLLDETEFLSDHGVRSVSKAHAAKPFVFEHNGSRFIADYEPGESTSNLFGGNSNWRGPVWMPINFLVIEALYEFDRFFGSDFTVECPTGSGTYLRMSDVAEEISKRLCRLFLRNAQGWRPVHGDRPMLQTDARFKDYVPFNEYFHGDDGRGLGAAHQTGWTGLVALLIQPRLNALDGLMPVAHSLAPA